MALVDATTASGNQSPSSTYILKDDLSVSRESIEGRIRSSCDMEGHTFTALTAVLQNSAAAAKWDGWYQWYQRYISYICRQID